MESNKERLQNLISSINEKQAEALCDFFECMREPNQPKEEKKVEKVAQITKSPYEKNETMRLIGFQIFPEGGMQALRDITKAWEITWGFDNDPGVQGAIMDTLLYGVIIGKRTERQRKRAI